MYYTIKKPCEDTLKNGDRQVFLTDCRFKRMNGNLSNPQMRKTHVITPHRFLESVLIA